jgi:hypothetical protein
MKRFIALAVLGVFALPVSANAQHKFVYRAEFTAEGLNDPQKRTAVGLRTNVIKATEPALLILWYAIRTLHTVAPVCLCAIERPIRCLDKVGETLARIDRHCYPDADRCRQYIRANR